MVLLLDKLIKPEDSLQERLFLCEPAPVILQVALDTETMLDVRIQIHLVRHTHLLENILCLTPLLGREDLIGF